jgi:hypothetical protein
MPSKIYKSHHLQIKNKDIILINELEDFVSGNYFVENQLAKMKTFVIV